MSPADTPQHTRLAALAAPAIAWALHFVLIYAAISAACAARALIEYPTVVLLTAAGTVAALAVCLWPVLRPGPPEAPLARAGRWAGVIFGLAVLFQAAILFFFQGCGG